LLATLLVFCGLAIAAPSLPPLNEPPSGERHAGKLIWFDLATPDLGQQKSFYQGVFGWTYRSPGASDDGYTLVMNGGRTVAGMFSFEPPDGEKDAANWIVLMSVDDPDQAVSAARANGGKVAVEAVNVPRRGRHALLKDPGDSLFGVLRSDSGDPPDTATNIGDIIWADLFALDVEKMSRFYQAITPYETHTMPITEEVNRVILSSDGINRAGIVPVGEDANRAAWVPYVRVENVDAVLEKVVEGGGFAIVEPHPDLLDGNLAIFVDPNGAVVGIVKWEETAGGAR